MGNYPGSVNAGDVGKEYATPYGSLPDHGLDDVALVLHTTETSGIPGFNEGDTAPHYVYEPAKRRWIMFLEPEDGYVGTMKGHTSGGHSNCKAIQVEIVGYSSLPLAVERGKANLWVGNFTDQHYQDLADFVRWIREGEWIGTDVTPTPAGGWKSGADSPLRMSTFEWEQFSGLTAHGAVPNGNSHWDTGVLDLVRINDLSLEEVVNPCPWQPPCDSHFQLEEWGENSKGVCNVPVEQHDAIAWAVAEGIIKTTDNFRDDYLRPLTDGRYYVLEWRAAGSPQV